jgi:putative ABC transport system permease protein
VGGPNGVDEVIYARLVRSGLPHHFAPILTEYISSPQLGGGLVQLLGVDPFAEAPFRDYFEFNGKTTSGRQTVTGNLLSFLTQPGTILVSTTTAERYQVEIGDPLTIELGGVSMQVQVVGLIEPSDTLSRQALDTLILTDIATAQELTGRVGRVDRIDVILIEGNEKDLAAVLPEGAQLIPVEARSGTMEQMTDAFRVNLTALSLLALVVGLFLIYNTMTFAVVQRRPLFGILRCLGVTRREIFLLVVIEAFIVGILGSGLGIALGIVMGQGAVRLVTQTINDLFFVLSVQGIQLPISSLVKGALLGIISTVLTAAPPALEAASVPPRSALSRSGLERKAQRVILFVASVGLILIALGVIVLVLPWSNLWVSFLGTFIVVTGFAMLAPTATILFSRIVSPLLVKIWGALGRMATRDVVNSLSRTAVAVAALMVAVSVTIGVSIMVGSFRKTVQIWLEQVLQGDIYISAPSLIAAQTSTPIQPEIVEQLQARAEISEVFTLRAITVDSPEGPIQINASSNQQVARERLYLIQDGTIEQMEARMLDGAVVISEPLANRLGLLETASEINLFTDQGLKTFPIIGVYYDYGSTVGNVLMSQKVYQTYWNDPSITAISIKLNPGIEPDELARNLRDELSQVQRLAIRPNLILRQEVMEIFDRTFAITGALQLLATVVAFMGVLGALLSLELERQRELGILRAVGLTIRQLWRLIMLETGILGSVAGILAMPTGYVLALILIYIINRRSFGWTLQIELIPDPFIQAFVLALMAALLAGLYPAWRISRMVTAEAMRFE